LTLSTRHPVGCAGDVERDLERRHGYHLAAKLAELDEGAMDWKWVEPSI
jgi:hypothetical protein